MTGSISQPSREDVLDAFAVEQHVGREVLERYLRDYPQYAAEIVDLSRELWRVVVEDDEPLSTEDQALINTAWRRHLEAAPMAVIDPLAALSVGELRDIAKHLNVPRQVITAFREHRVVVASVPRRFLARFAAAVNSTVELFNSTLASPPGPNLARSYKADNKPGNDAPVTFERLLIDAGIPEAMRALLMADDD